MFIRKSAPRVTAAALLIAASLWAQASKSRTVWDGVYTAPQAARGEQAFMTSCSSCHIDGQFTAEKFLSRYRGENLANLFGFIKQNMPAYQPGSLPPEKYLDIIAFILKQNTVPAGKDELTADALDSIQFTAKP
jgi:mono/diheme cytochrome c family protein